MLRALKAGGRGYAEPERDGEAAGRAPRLLSWAERAASSAAAPKRSRRPPNATAQTENQAKPSARPAITSLSQCTSSSTRLPATMTTSPAAVPGDGGPHAATAAAAEQQRGRGEERGGPRRVAARKGRPERLRDRVQRRPHAISEVLDRRGQDAVPGHDDEQEGHDPRAPRPQGLHDGQDRPPARRPRRLAQVSDGVSPSVENADACRSPQFATLSSSRTRSASTADEIGEHREQHATTHDRDQREGQPEAGCGSRIKPRGKRAAGPRMAPHRPTGLARRAHGGGRGSEPHARPAPRERHHDAGSHDSHEE